MHTLLNTCTYTVHPRPPVVNRTNIFVEDGIVVLLEWMEQSGVTYNYNVTITPQVPIVWISGTSVKVRVDYNVNYNMTILLSATLCGQNSVDMIFFGKSQLLLSIILVL